MVSLSLPTLVEEWRTRPRNTLATSKDALLVVSFGNPVAADFAQFIFDSGDRHVSLVSDPEISKHVSKGLVCRPLLDTSSHLRAGKTDT